MMVLLLGMLVGEVGMKLMLQASEEGFHLALGIHLCLTERRVLGEFQVEGKAASAAPWEQAVGLAWIGGVCLFRVGVEPRALLLQG